jgi:hypothetical protein
MAMQTTVATQSRVSPLDGTIARPSGDCAMLSSWTVRRDQEQRRGLLRNAPCWQACAFSMIPLPAGCSRRPWERFSG